MLSRPIFQRIVSFFGRPDIDLFASRLHAQVETFVSWRPQPMAKFVDAFSNFSFILFHPFWMCAEDNSRSSIGNPCYSSVDNSTLFHGCTQLADRHASYSESFSSESGSPNSGRSSSTSSTIGPVGMQVIRQSLQQRDFTRHC